MPMGEVRKMGNGGAVKGPTPPPALIFFINFAETIAGLCRALFKLGDSKEDNSPIQEIRKPFRELVGFLGMDYNRPINSQTGRARDFSIF